jgi:single-strand DNA-binding protein
MLNHIVLQSRLVRDPELRRLPSGKSVASVSVACDRDFTPKDGGERETDFIDIVAFGATADHLCKWFTKGKMIIISGRLQIRNWTDKEGNKRRSAEVVADSVYFGDSKKSSEGNSTYQAPIASQGSENPYAESLAYAERLMAQGGIQSDFAMLEDTDELLPF